MTSISPSPRTPRASGRPWQARPCSRACATPSVSTRTSCAARCGASLLLAAAAGDPNEAHRRRRRTGRHGALGGACERRAPARAGRCDPQRPGPGDRRASAARCRRAARARGSGGGPVPRLAPVLLGTAGRRGPRGVTAPATRAQPLPAARARARLPGVDLDRAVGARRDRARPAESLRPERRRPRCARERDRARATPSR